MNIFYCIEDELSRAVAERLLRDYCPFLTSTQELGQAFGGYGYIKKNLQKFRDLAQSHPVLIITDLDSGVCAPSLRSSWLAAARISEPLPEKMLFCVAKSEIESWLLADTAGISDFLRISPSKLRSDIEDTVRDSKGYLVRLAKSSPDATIRSDLAPSLRSSAATGINYNFRMSKFVCDSWNPEEAAQNNASLNRTVQKLSSLKP